MALWKCSHQCHWFAYQMNLISGWIILLLDKKYRITFCLLAGWRCAWHLLGVLSYCQTRIRSYSPEQHVCCRYECFQWKFDSDIKKNIYIQNEILMSKLKTRCSDWIPETWRFILTFSIWTMPLHRMYMLLYAFIRHMAHFGKRLHIIKQKPKHST